MDIEHEKTENGGVISATHKGKPVAQLAYTRVGPKHFRIDNTRIREEAKGRGVGKKLAMKVAEHAKKAGAKISVADDGARRVFRNNPELQALLSD